MNDFETDQENLASLPPIRELTKSQRRVLGTLIEKAFTVPESYPMTLKGLTVGCNQKSNRDPVSSYTEDGVLDAVDELRQLGLVAVVHTESGRTERYRHYTRKRFPFSEPQLAIITELMLRGRQQLGELRARASRMVAIESLEELRKELEGLIAGNYVQADGPLDRRGVEVDHKFYQPQEAASRISPASHSSSSLPAVETESTSSGQAILPAANDSAGEWRQTAGELREKNQALELEMEELRNQLQTVRDDLAELKRTLGA